LVPRIDPRLKGTISPALGASRRKTTAIMAIPGAIVVAAGVLFHGGWAAFAFVT
jgi:hypothetical protein